MRIQYLSHMFQLIFITHDLWQIPKYNFFIHQITMQSKHTGPVIINVSYLFKKKTTFWVKKHCGYLKCSLLINQTLTEPESVFLSAIFSKKYIFFRLLKASPIQFRSTLENISIDKWNSGFYQIWFKPDKHKHQQQPFNRHIQSFYTWKCSSIEIIFQFIFSRFTWGQWKCRTETTRTIDCYNSSSVWK